MTVKMAATFQHFSKWPPSKDKVLYILQQQVCRYTVPWALFEESMPPTQISYRYSQLQEKHRWQSEISIDSKWRPIFKMAATR